jgi:uncharacterized repeat protein (TIGR01451 family)
MKTPKHLKSLWLNAAAAGAVAGASLLAGCDSSAAQRDTEPLYIGVSRAPAEPKQAASTPVTTESTKVDRGAETTYVSDGITQDATELAFPTGDKRTSTILLRQSAPSEMRVGQEYDYTIDVINLTNADVQNVIVNAENFSNLSYISSNPQFTKVGSDDIAWLIGDLPAHATKTIKIKAKANALGTATNCLSVTYANVLCIATNVVQPAIQLVKTATPELCGTCDEVKLTYEVKNTGTGVAEKTVIKDTLPAGLTTVDGKTVVELNAGDIPSGGSKPFTVMAKAAKPGTYSSAATATAYPQLSVNSSAPTTVVKQPSLTVTCDASNKVYVGRDITYKFTVKNTGNCPASNASVKAPVPAGTSFVSADNGGRVEGGSVVWSMPSIAAGQTTTVTMLVKPTGIGSAPITATAIATCVPAATTNCATEVAGIPAILLEVVDTVDPVEVGSETTFIATVTNQGSADDDDIVIMLTLPDQMEFISGAGPGPAVTANGKSVKMGPVSDLFPQQKAEWRIRVRAKGTGDTRTKWVMTSKQFTAPVEETESTNLYK